MNVNARDLAMKVAWLAALGLTVLVASKVLGNVANKADR